MILRYYEMVEKEYGDLYKSITGVDINDLLISLKDELVEIENIQLDKKKCRKYIASTKAYKSNWVNGYKAKADSEYRINIKAAQVIFDIERKGECEIGTFKRAFNCNSIEEYELILSEKIDDWKNNEDSKLTDFVGFETLSTKTAKVNGIKQDIINGYFKYINEQNKNKVTKVPGILGSIGVDTSNRLPFFNDLDIEYSSLNIELKERFDKKIISADKSSQLIMELEKKLYTRLQNDKMPNEIITQIALVKAMKDINAIDAQILNLFYTNLYNVVRGEGIKTNLSDIAKEIGFRQSEEQYKLIKNSLLKLSSLRLISDNYEGNQISGLLLEVDFLETETGNKVIVYLGNFLRKLIMLDSTFNFNKYVYDNLSGDAQQIAVWLQNRRIKRVSKGEGNTDRMSAMFLASSINISLSNMPRVKKRINEALIELKESKIVVNDFTIKPREKFYTIEYIELPQDISERIKSKELKSDELVEGIEYKQIK